MTINTSKPLETINSSGNVESVNFVFLSAIGVVYVVKADVNDGSRVMAFDTKTGLRCNDMGEVSVCVGNLKLRNCMQVVWVNFHCDGHAFHYPDEETAQRRAELSHPDTQIATAVRVELPL